MSYSDRTGDPRENTGDGLVTFSANQSTALRDKPKPGNPEGKIEKRTATEKQLALRYGSRRQRNWKEMETVGGDWLRTGVSG